MATMATYKVEEHWKKIEKLKTFVNSKKFLPKYFFPTLINYLSWNFDTIDWLQYSFF